MNLLDLSLFSSQCAGSPHLLIAIFGFGWNRFQHALHGMAGAGMKCEGVHTSGPNHSRISEIKMTNDISSKEIHSCSKASF